MKKYKSLFGFLILLVLATGCEDFLEEDNKSNAVSEEFFATEAGYESLVHAAYSSLRTVYRDPWVFVAGTDMYVEGRNTQPEAISEYRDLTPITGEVETFYRRTYEAIQTCNAALYFNDKTQATANLPVRKGEVQFLRAYYYFLLVQQFGGVSIVTDRINAPVQQFNRNSAEEVYDFIITEMNAALAVVPETSAQFGRVNKRAIRHFLAKVHLTRGYEQFGTAADFEQAAALADEAIAGQSLTLPFESVFTPGNERNAEILFSIQFDAVSMPNLQNSGNTQSYYFGPYMGGQGAAEGYPYRSYNLVPTMYVFDLFNQNDSRFEGTFMVNYYNRYYDYYDKQSERSTLGIRYYYAPQWANSPSDIAAWRAADPARRTNTTVIPYSPTWEASRGTVLDNATPAVKKFDDPRAVFSNNGSSTRDFFLARLAETYLIAAEAYFKLGNPGTAAERINEVRRRAAKPGSDLSITAADVDINFILDERARELVGEYHRWFDLKRTGTLMERTRLYNRSIRRWYDQGIDPFEGANGSKILRPIPQRAIDLNNADFAQNPGY